jgi:hypothetical protein
MKFYQSLAVSCLRLGSLSLAGLFLFINLSLAVSVRGQSGCEATNETMQGVRQQLSEAPDNDELGNLLQKLKYVTTAGCPEDGDAWYLRAKVEAKLGQPAEFSLSQAKRFRSALQKSGVDPFSKSAASNNTPATSTPSVANADSKPPVLLITEPSDTRAVGVKAANRLRVAGQATDESGIRAITVNGAPVNFTVQGAFSVEVALQAQDRQLVVTATDNAGLSASKTIALNRDLVVANSTTPLATPAVEGQFYALLIAVQKYDHPSVKPLNQPISDARRVKEVLTTGYTFASDRVALLENPSSEQITDELDRLAKVLRPEDHLLVFYAGHGHWDKELGQGYWLPRDAQADKRAKWISNSTLRDYIKGIRTRHTLLISDACFSGGLLETRAAFESAPPSIQELARLKSRTAMTSGTLTEVPDKSVFVDYLLRRLQENREAFFSATTLFHSFREAVVNNSPVMDGGQRTLPQYGRIQEAGHEGGDFIFVRK